MLPFPEPTVCSLCVNGLCLCFLYSLMSTNCHITLNSPLIKTRWEHCDFLCEIFLEAFTLFSSSLLFPTLFLWFFSLEPPFLVLHFQFWIPHKPLDVNVELWFLACPWTLSRTVAYTHHLTHALQTVLGEDSALTVNSELWVLTWTLNIWLIGVLPTQKRQTRSPKNCNLLGWNSAGLWPV